jgi:phage protein D
VYVKYVDVYTPFAEGVSLRATDFSWSQSRYEHDFGTLTLKDWNVDPLILAPGTPLEIKLTGRENSKRYYGYIHHTSHKRLSDTSATKVYIIGASFVMKQPSQKVYANVTAADVAIAIAKKYNFAYDVAPHPRVYPQIAQAGETDWQLLVKLAKQCGYTFRVDGTTLYFKPFSEDFDRLKFGATDYFAVTFNSSIPPRLYQITPSIGENIDYGDGLKAAPAALGVDVKSGKTYKAYAPNNPRGMNGSVNEDLFDTYLTATSTDSYQAAKHEVEGADELNRFSYRATASLMGSPDIRPDAPVYFSGLNEELNGYWVVLEVEHIAGNDGFFSLVVVGKDSLDASKKPPTKKAMHGVKPADSYLHLSAKPIKTKKKLKVTKVENRLQKQDAAYITAVWRSTKNNIRASAANKAKVAAILGS